MKRFWLLALLMAGMLTVALSSPASAAKMDQGNDESATDQSEAIDDINSALGSMAVKLNDMDSKMGGLKFYGDIRGRYALWTQSQGDKKAPAPDTISDKAVGRYRARLGVKDSFGDISGAMRISTGSLNPNSENQTYDNGFGNPGIIIDTAFLTYNPGWLDKMVKVTAGKMGNPLMNTPMTWDPDIDPEGAALEFAKNDFHFVASYFDLVNTAGTAQSVSNGVTNTAAASDEFMANLQLDYLLKLDDDSSVKAMVGYEYIPNVTALAGGTIPAGFLGPNSAIGTPNTPVGSGNIWDFHKTIPDFHVGEAMLQVKNKFGDVPMQWTAHVIDNLGMFNVPVGENLTTGPANPALGYTNLSNQLGLYLEAKGGSTNPGHWLGCVALSYVEPNAQLANLASDDANFTNTEYLFEQVGYGMEKNVSLLLSVWEMQRIYYAYYGALNNKLITSGGTSQDPEFQVYADCVMSF